MKIKNIVFLLLIPCCAAAQQELLQLGLGQIDQEKIDSMRVVLNTSPNDSLRFQMAATLASFFQFKNSDSAFFYSQKASAISGENGKYLADAASQKMVMYHYQNRGDFSNAWLTITKALEIARDPESEGTHFIYPPGGNLKEQRIQILIMLEVTLGDLLLHTNNYRESIYHFENAIQKSNEIGDFALLHQRYLHLSWAYTGLEMPDSSLHYALLAERAAKEKNLRYNVEFVYNNKGDILFRKGMVQQAMESYYEGLKTAEEDLNQFGIIDACLGLADCYLYMRRKDSSLYYIQKAQHQHPPPHRVHERLYKFYELNNENDSAFKYLVLTKRATDNNTREFLKNLAGFQHLFLQDRTRLQELEKEKILSRNKTRTYLLFGGIGLLLLLLIIFYRNSRQKQKAAESIAKAYRELKNTQQQLLQREKMASLGELTAGIAHEIQNPLNFVNNFSEVNDELLKELKAEAEKGNMEEVRAIANDIESNSEKINHHGKRADLIVKGMLQHSRTSSGQIEPTDPNALVEEYLRLAYHGLRAKDKSFNAITKTEFDNSIGKINIVAQDIGRVILNLINNAFYAVNEKQKQSLNARPDAPVGRGYEPTVTVTTAKQNGKIEIKVKDNGNGIPPKVLDKIFQPFFTTKPAGQGTGLGLSLAYDIITKGHGGELKVETKEGEGSTFIITLTNT